MLCNMINLDHNRGVRTRQSPSNSEKDSKSENKPEDIDFSRLFKNMPESFKKFAKELDEAHKKLEKGMKKY